MPEPEVPLAAALTGAMAELLRTTGAVAARVVDGRCGTVIAQVGPAEVDGSGAAELAGLVRLACDAVPGHGSDDLVVATSLSVHVLREARVPGTFLHVRLDRNRGDVVAVRRALAAPALHRAVLVALAGAREEPPGPFGRVEPDRKAPRPAAPRPGLRDPRRTGPPTECGVPGDPAPRGSALSGSAQQPALALVNRDLAAIRSGALAVSALPPLPGAVPPSAIPLPVPLPRRTHGSRVTLPALRQAPEVLPDAPAVWNQAWARDLDTMALVLTGLRRLG